MRRIAALLALLLVSAGAHLSAQSPAPQGYRVDIRYDLGQRHAPAAMELAGGIILFKVKLGARDGWMMLDNGADHSVIDAALVGPLGLVTDTRPGRTLRTPTGAMPYRIALGVPLVIPGQLETSMPMAAVELGSFAAQLGHPVDAILGGDFLHATVLTLDFDKGAFDVAPPAGQTLSGATPVALLGGKPQFDATVGGKPVRLTIDLGYSGDLALTPEAWARVGPADAKRESRLQAHLDGATFTVDHATLPQIEIGATLSTDIGTDIRPVPARDGDGWIGLGLLSRFAVLMDVKEGKLWLRPRAGVTAERGVQ